MFGRLILALLLVAPAAAFAPMASRAMPRKAVVSMSHFSNVKTELR